MGVSIRNNTCAVCGKQFKSISNTRKYCSIECKATALSRRPGRDYAEVLEKLKRQEKQKQKGKNSTDEKPVEKPVEKYDSKLDETPVAWRCHDCARPSSTYRCPECKAKWLKKHGVTPCKEEAHDDRYRAIF